MKYLTLIILLSTLLSLEAQGQKLRRTYPIDSCLYLMDPYNFKIKNLLTTGGGGQVVVTVFRSTGTADLVIMGKGRFVVLPDDLPPDLVLSIGATGDLLMSVPELPPGADEWPGGQPPFPLILYGFLEKVAGVTITPPLPISMQVQQLFMEDTTQ